MKSPDKIYFTFFQKLLAVCLFVFLILQALHSTAGNEIPDTLIKPESNLKIENQFTVDTVFHALVANESRMRAGLLFDATERKIVWQKDLNYAYPIASLTKMMVALLTVEDINNCQADWTDEIVLNKRYVKRVKRKKVIYSRNETYTLDALFRLAMIASNNEACMYIAKHLDGSVENFVSRMNARARELNMNNTYYSNPSGLPSGKKDFDNNSSVHDLLLLSIEMLKYPEILNVTKIGYADVANDKSSGIYRNHNRLVIDYENEVDGLKTGYTKKARFCLAATSNKASRRMISIVLGVASPYERNEIVADMLSNYYEFIGIGRLANNVPLPKINRENTEEFEQGIVDNSEGNYKTIYTKEKKFIKVRGGETLSGIADRFNSTVTAIKKWNHLRSSRIMKGQRLLVYVTVKKRIQLREDQIEKDENDEEAPTDSINGIAPNIQDTANETKTAVKKILVKKDEKKPAVKFVYHLVQPGDTLWGIAQKYEGVTVAAIKKTNRITSSRNLKAGTKLKIILNS
ncbi:MAG TPA: LysM peptidoglycan-binding domain-containing protein [Bacteroidia bacterium]|nr:LysM peptidoglycan-binding domain-containing protein [Bacteroidia bacterium]